MSKNTKGNGANDASAVIVVTPDNIGKGIKWNETTGKYEVNVGDGLIINEAGEVVTNNKPIIRTFDNGTGEVIHQQAVIDYGGVLEISGTIMLPLPPDPEALLNLGGDRPEIQAYRDNQARATGIRNLVVYGGCGKADGGSLGLAYPGQELYYHEVGVNFPYAELGISKVISVSATAGDVPGWRKETAWAVNSFSSVIDYVPVGIHVYMSKGQTHCALSYTIKGIKA